MTPSAEVLFVRGAGARAHRELPPGAARTFPGAVPAEALMGLSRSSARWRIREDRSHLPDMVLEVGRDEPVEGRGHGDLAPGRMLADALESARFEAIDEAGGRLDIRGDRVEQLPRRTLAVGCDPGETFGIRRHPPERDRRAGSIAGDDLRELGGPVGEHL